MKCGYCRSPKVATEITLFCESCGKSHSVIRQKISKLEGKVTIKVLADKINEIIDTLNGDG